MKNILRFELKRRWDNLWVYFAVILIINILAVLALGFGSSQILMVTGLLVTLVSLLFVSPSLLFSQDIKSINEDFYSDKRYLTWSIPANGIEYLGAKFIASTIQMIIAYLMLWFFPALEFMVIKKGFREKSIYLSNGSLVGIFFKMFIAIFLLYFFILMIIYLSKTLRKGFRYNERPGSFLSVVIFFMLFEIEGDILRLVRFIPWNNKLALKIPCEIVNEGREIVLRNYMNISVNSIVFVVLMILVMFIITSKLIEKEIDV